MFDWLLMSYLYGFFQKIFKFSSQPPLIKANPSTKDSVAIPRDPSPVDPPRILSYFSPAPPTMPVLPTELWWLILRFSVRDPAIFEKKWDHSPDYLLFYQGWELHDYLDPSFSRKLTICRVSRTWRDIGVELLYEHLEFRKVAVFRRIVQKIATIFEQNADRAGYGRSTKRIDVAVEVLHNSYFPSFLRLLKCCHNIQIFIITSDPSTKLSSDNLYKFRELFNLLQTRFGHSLRRLKFNFNDAITRSFSCSLPNIPLETLHLSNWHLLADHQPPTLATVSSLSLDLPNGIYNLPPWRFPALRHLSLHRVKAIHSSVIQSFLDINGPHLISLRLESLANTFPSVPGFLLATTNLRCLILPILPHQFPDNSRFPSITHIGVLTLYPYRSQMEESASSPCFPGLQCIRYLGYVRRSKGPANEAAPASPPLLGIIRNIRFEDRQGLLIEGH